MSDDKMRDEFESWAKRNGCDIVQAKEQDGYWLFHTHLAWLSWQAAYQAGLKAEREAIFIEWENGEVMAAEVERLRAELAQLRKDWCDDDEAIKQQALRVLDAAKVEGDSVYVPRMGALAEMMADELVKVRDELWEKKVENVHWEEAYDRLKAELAAAKADLAMVEATVAENELLRVTNERLAADLAAAKAASVVPVKIEEVRLPTISQKPYDTVIATKTFGDMCRFRNWLRDRMKDTAPPTT